MTAGHILHLKLHLLVGSTINAIGNALALGLGAILSKNDFKRFDVRENVNS